MTTKIMTPEELVEIEERNAFTMPANIDDKIKRVYEDVHTVIASHRALQEEKEAETRALEKAVFSKGDCPLVCRNIGSCYETSYDECRKQGIETAKRYIEGRKKGIKLPTSTDKQIGCWLKYFREWK